MDAGLVTSLSGALAQSKQVEKVANNIANADTPGYKADELMFEEALQGKQHSDLRAEIPERALTRGELLSKAGDEKTAVLYGQEFTDMRAGNYKKTGNPLDLSIEGNGFFEVAVNGESRLTRAGSFTVDEQGRLVTKAGHLLLGPGAPGANPEGRAIVVGQSRIHVDLEGNIYTSGGPEQNLVGQIGIVRVADPSLLQKRGNNTFEAPPEALAQAAGPAPAAEGAANNPLGSLNVAPKVHQGMLEGSNVNAVGEMTKLIKAQRLFEQNTRLMQSFGNLNTQAAELGKF